MENVLSAAGVGGIVGGAITSLLQSWLLRRAALDEREFQEKKEANVNFLQAMHRLRLKKRPRLPNMSAIRRMFATWSLRPRFGARSAILRRPIP